MSMVETQKRPAGCLSDITFDRLMSNNLASDSAVEGARLHMASCTRCRQRLAAFEGVDAPSFEKLFAKSLEKRTGRGATRWTMPAITLAAAAAALVVTVRARRSGPISAETRTKGALSLDVVLRRPSGDVTRPAPGESVFWGDALRFEVSASQPGFVTVLGLDAAGAVTVYAPPSESTMHLEPGAPHVLPGSIVADSTLGPERIIAVLCAQPSKSSELRQAALRALSHAGNDPKRVNGLGTDCEETSFMIDKKARP